MNAAEKNPLLLAPAPCGWRALAVTPRGEWIAEECGSFAEAVTRGEELVAGFGRSKELPVEVALPARCGVFERLTLPSIDADELDSMVRLQFEKNLPYPAEETSVSFQTLSQNGQETTLMACAVHEPEASALCAPLLEGAQRAVPVRMAFWAMHAAAQAGTVSAACGLWREEGRTLFGIFEKGRLGFIETLAEGGGLCSALPGILMRAEIAGAPVEFAEMLLDPALREAGPELEAFFGVPTRSLQARGGEIGGVDLTPGQWRAEQTRRARRGQLVRRLILAAILYVAALIAGFVCLGLQNRQLDTLRRQAAVLQPRVDGVIERQARWKALAPAVDKQQFAVERLFQAWQCLPSAETRITRFELGRGQLTLEGEAPNAQQAIEYAEKIKKQPGLGDYHFEAGPPAILPNEHAQFRIFGKQ